LFKKKISARTSMARRSVCTRSINGRSARLGGAVVPGSGRFVRVVKVEASTGEATLEAALDALASASLVVK
jgi:hypothetical protein